MPFFNHLLPITTLLLFAFIATTHGYICSNPSDYEGLSMCDFSGKQCGQCVSFVKQCTNDKRKTDQWTRGRKVRGANIPFGTAIATFPGGKYSGHAAIYVSQNSAGIQVYDQWTNNPVSRRTIRWNGAKLSNNGDSFYVID